MTRYKWIIPYALITSAVMVGSGQVAAQSKDRISFDMVVSQGARTCLPDAQGEVTIKSDGEAEDMTVSVSGLPPKTGFDFFVILESLDRDETRTH